MFLHEVVVLGNPGVFLIEAVTGGPGVFTAEVEVVVVVSPCVFSPEVLKAVTAGVVVAAGPDGVNGGFVV